ncbi:hypothetical protein JCGZ_11052 [Jatropha curcas]|uniref:Uncharacterized protein n=1 Tax=Jatropha curcas TaxID=180498 RepID=A0A067KEE9_JATCU|nr:hypothetical protein JCGZ_11052 [Jatropha curcas]
MDQALLYLPFLVFLPIVFIFFKKICFPPSKQCRLPPGPRPWPIVGNIPHIGKKLHISLTNIAKVHGPLISLRLGTQLVIVGSSSKAAIEILKHNDRLLSARSIPKAVPRKSHVLERLALVWNPTCNDQWKSFRTLCRTELFSAKAVEAQAALREKKMTEMIEYLSSQEGEAVNIGEIVFATVFNTISNLLFSKDFMSLQNQGLKSLLWRMIELAAAPNVADFYPIFVELDLQGIRRQMAKCLKEMFGICEIYIKERRERHANAHNASSTDFLDVFLSNGLDDDQINWLFMELFSAGVDTTTTTVEWAIAELLKNKQAMKTLQQELETKINRNPIQESQVSQLLYLNACVKETLRLHPPAPFLLPHCATEACELMNFVVPKNTRVLVNVWAIARDPLIWEDSELFKPERFLHSGLDFKSQNFDFLPFGSGRRICPGLPMAIRQLPMILASLIHHFDWSLPNGEDPALLDMTDKFGITLQKEQPLFIVPKRK